VYGLLDSGASISCVGDSLAVEVEAENVPFRAMERNAVTADGSPQRIIGRIKVEIEYANVMKWLPIYIVPSLKHDLYLGIDFWKHYDLLLKSLVEASDSSSADTHVLSEDQREKLSEVINCFPSFTEDGLGNPNLITHSIDVGSAKPIKQRHFSVSPAVGKAMYTEIDRMLQLGVIEESQSAWSSPIVMVNKPGKIRICLDCRKVSSFTEKDA